MKYIILDWTGKDCFEGRLFKTFDAAEKFLSEFLGDTYETDRQEYSIEEAP